MSKVIYLMGSLGWILLFLAIWTPDELEMVRTLLTSLLLIFTAWFIWLFNEEF